MEPQPLNQSLAEIVADAQRGDAGALEQLVLRCRPIAARYAFSLLGDRALAEDAAQEAVTHAIRDLAGLRVPEAFVTWLRRIVFRYCDRITRGRRFQIVSLVDVIDPADTDPQPDELVLRAERALAVRAAIGRLPEAQRDAAAAFYLEDLTQAEAAELLGIPVSTLNNRLHAARRTLERTLFSMTYDHIPGAPEGGMRLAAPVPDADADRVLHALESSSPAGADWRHGRLSQSRFDWATSRVGIENGEVRAIVGVYEVAMRIGGSAVRTAGFNLDYSAPGLSEEDFAGVTAETATAAAAAGYAVAVAVGHSKALADAGFVPAWAHQMTFVPTAQLPAEVSADVEAFDPVHRDDIAELDDAEHAGLTGSGIGATYLANKEPGGFQGVLWTDGAGNVAGYVSYAVVDSWRNPALHGPAHTGYGRLLWHDRSAGDPPTRLAVIAELAREHGCAEVAFDRLHPRSPLARSLRPLRHRVEHGHRRYSIKVLSLEAAVGSILDELNERSLADGRLGDIELGLAIDDQRVVVRGTPGDLAVEPAAAHDGTRSVAPDAIEGDQRLANLLVGTGPPAEVLLEADAVISGDAHRLAEILFPFQDPQMDNQSL